MAKKLCLTPSLFHLFLVSLLFFLFSSDCSAYSYDESMKVASLLNGRGIDPMAIPIGASLGRQRHLSVDVSFLMTGLVAVDIAHENIKFTAAIYLRWRDYNMAWNLSVANTTFVVRSAKSMWHPQLMLTTSVNDLTMIRPDPRFDQIVIRNDVSCALHAFLSAYFLRNYVYDSGSFCNNDIIIEFKLQI